MTVKLVLSAFDQITALMLVKYKAVYSPHTSGLSLLVINFY